MNILAIVVGVLSILVVLFMAYIVFLQLQLANINRQLAKRLNENTRQPISLELLNSELNALAININKCLKAEETLRVNSIREEKRFKEQVANISHDLRTPLTAIKGYQQLLAKGSLSEEQQEKLRVAQKYADKLGDLIEHFFEYSLHVNAEPKLAMNQLNLSNLLTECLAESIHSFEDNNLTLHYKETVPVFIMVDREYTIRIIQNLIRNGITHSAGDIEVNLSAKQNAVLTFKNPVNNNADIEVTRLFERFYTADTARRNSTGLGLSIVKLLTEQMGGNTNATLQGNMLEIRVELPLCEKGK
ncbi:sensor histidine kinase [Paenibacillus segetis]|uniref:sensor histidine kinase n=1 Tax=Paenibacillus segetis TaxID=1325360 RepID=UPI003571064A